MAKPRKRRKAAPAWVKEKADAAERRAKGLPLDKPRKPIDPPAPKEAKGGKPPAPAKPPTVYPIISPGTRPKYKDEYAKVAAKMCKLGATDADLADAFEVDTSTIWRWQSRHEAFCSALRVGKGAYDDQVERSLALRARGFAYDAVKVMQHNGDPVYAPYREYVPPDVGAAKLWLTNRRPEQWRESSEQVHKLDATETVLKIVQYISAGGDAKLIEAKP